MKFTKLYQAALGNTDLLFTPNKREFLVSSGGDRRYWIIECNGLIDNKLLEQERDLIWGAAKAAYESGEGWYLEYTEQQELSLILSGFKLKREGQEEIEEFLESLGERTVFLTKELRDYLDIPTNDRKFTQQARRILEELGWINGLYSVNGEKGKGYKYLRNDGKPNGKPSKPTENLGLPHQTQSEKELESIVNQVNLNQIESLNNENTEIEVSNNTGNSSKTASHADSSERFTTFTATSNPCGCQENSGKPKSKGKPNHENYEEIGTEDIIFDNEGTPWRVMKREIGHLHLKRSNGETAIASRSDWREGKYHHVPSDAELVKLMESVNSSQKRKWLHENFGGRILRLIETNSVSAKALENYYGV